MNNMRKHRYIQGLFLALTMLVVSCTDFVEPRVPYAEFNTGAYLRTIERTSVTFNFFDLATSRFALTLEAVDIEDGGTVETVEIRVRHRRLIPGVGLEYIPAINQPDVLLKTLTKADFAPNADSRFLRTSFEISATAAIEALGVTVADIEGGDTFEFRLIMTDRFGRIFSDQNRSPDVGGGVFYASPFIYNVGVVCPSDLGGTFRTLTVQATGPFGSCPANTEGEITFKPRADGVSYDVSDGTFGYWACVSDTWGSGSVVLRDACEVLSLTGTDKYGDSYSMEVIEASASQITIAWENSYGEGGTVIIFANDGKPWPDGIR
jgi:hypothetical protein